MGRGAQRRARSPVPQGRPAGGAARVGLRALGIGLVVLPFVPIQTLLGEGEGTGGLVPPGEWLLGLWVFGACAWLCARLLPAFPGWAGEAAARLSHRLPGRRFTAAWLVILGVLLLLVATLAFARRPLLVDSVVQLFQAKIFAAGRITAPAPPAEAFFATQHMLVDGGRWYSQYPPGHSAFLALGVLLGRPWLVPIVLSLGTALLLSAFTRHAYDEPTGRLTLVLLALAPFFWFMGASFMNHVSCLFSVSLFLYLFARWEETGRGWWLAAAGLALGGAFLSRPLTGLAIGAVFAAAAARVAIRRGFVRSLVWGGAGVAVPIAFYLAYNAGTTGDPFLPGYLKLWGDSHGLGFHPTPWGAVHTPLSGLRNELVDLALLNGFLFEWPVPGLLPVGLFFAAGWADRSWDGRLAAGFVAIPAAYFFYWHRDAFLGPRYLYAGVAFAVPLTARAILAVLRRERRAAPEDRSRGVPGAESGSRGRNGFFRHLAPTGLATILLVLCFGYAVLYATPRRFRVYRSGLASMKSDLPAAAAAAGIRRALVFTPVSWGNRILARARGLGASAAAAEVAYRRADHCALAGVLDSAEAESWSPARVTEALLRLPAAGRRLGADSPNGDPTLRLAEGPLAPRCADEILYDGQGYGNFTPHLVDNDPFLLGPLVFARDLRGHNDRLRDHYRGFPAYLHRSGRFESLD